MSSINLPNEETSATDPSNPAAPRGRSASDWLMGCGEMSDCIRGLDWASTSLGARERWPSPLRTTVNILVSNKFPILLLWGPEHVQIYNDAFRQLAGDKHPQALGRTIGEVWPHLGALYQPAYQAVLQRGESLLFNGSLRVNNRGYEEEVHCILCHSPVHLDDGTVGGILVVIQDTTIIQTRERELRESEQRFRMMLENSQDGIYLLDLRTRRMLVASAAQTTLTGFTVDELGDLTADEMFTRIHPEDRIFVAEQWQRHVANPQQVASPSVLRWKVKSGEYRWLSTARRVLRDENGQPMAVVGTTRDITEQMRMEEQLRYQASLLDMAIDPVISTDATLHIRSWNKAAEALWGFREGEVLGRNLSEVVPLDISSDRDETLRERLMRDGLAQFDAEHCTKQGRRVYVHVQVVVMRDANGGVRGFLSSLHDITERKQTEQHREQLLEQLHAAQKQAADDLLVMSKLHQISSLYLHRASLDSILEAILDTAMALVGADLGSIRVFVPETPSLRLAVQRGFPAALNSAWESIHLDRDAYSWMLEHTDRIITDDVTQSPLLNGSPVLELYRQLGVRAAQVVPLVSRRRKLLGVLATHWKRPGRPSNRALHLLDMLSHQASDILEGAQAEASLRSTNAHLLEADQHKNQFLAMLSHELRNPLAPIKNSLYVIEHAASDSEQVRRAKVILHRQVGLLAHLVDDLLDVTRITRNKLHLQLQNFDLNELTQRLVDDHRSVIERAELRVELVLAPQPVVVEGDWNRLAQVVGNLLHNASKFTPPKGRVRVALSVAPDTRRAVLEVRDTGIGLTPERLGQLFQPFMQADAALDRSKSGLGLGLALVKGIVELHGGAVEAHSEGLGKGTTMVVQLPLTSKPVELTSPASSRSEVRSRRVLLIEDNIDAADSLRDLLELEGHQVEVAHSGPEGIAMVQQFSAEVIVCDIGLPGMSGFEVARALKADDALKDVYLVALSGYAQPEDRKQAAEAGFDHYITKPLNLSKLAELLAHKPKREGGCP